MVKKEIEDLVKPYTKDHEKLVELLEKAGALNITYGNEGVGKITDAFKTAFGTSSVSKWDRFAASRMAKKYSVEEIVQIIGVMATSQGQPYCPSVNSVSDLEKKWVMVGNYIKKNNHKEMGF